MRAPSPAIERRDSDALASRLAASMVSQEVTLSTLDGRFITGGVLQFAGTPLVWEGTLEHLTQAGALASLYFAEGVRDIVVGLADGRRARARLTGTAFQQGVERVCTLKGAEQLQ